MYEKVDDSADRVFFSARKQAENEVKPEKNAGWKSLIYSTVGGNQDQEYLTWSLQC